ncbi:MAG: L-aspartate oxidase [Patescibacteria group bacterium]
MNNKYDFIVIGSGVAGLNFALQASSYGTVAIITKKELMESNSNYAQGGIAAVIDKHDSTQKHIADTLKAGCNINNKHAVEVMVKEAPKQIQHLLDIGVGFNKTNGQLDLTQEGGHSARRIAHAKDATGKEIERALIYNVRQHKRISIFESHLAFKLLVKNNICSGVLVLNNDSNKVDQFNAQCVIIATGGAAQIFKRNCNPKIATGDGVSMAFTAGAKIKDLEFIQFHPTALALKNKPAFLISETVRGEGGILVNSKHEKFMAKYHPLKDLAPRDIVSRAIYNELKKGPVYIDIKSRGKKYLKTRFPYIYDQLWWYGIFMDKDLIPIAPAAHYMCGGIATDTYGRTNIMGLFAFGEVACTGVHGANRLASNSLLECLVFSNRALKSAMKYSKQSKYQIFTTKKPRYLAIDLNKINLLKKNIQRIMWKNVSIEREVKKMHKTLNKLNEIKNTLDKLYIKGVNRNLIEVKNLCQVAILVTTSAINRKQSIGCHFLKT